MTYAGYVTWRGFAAPETLSAETRALLADALTYVVLQRSHYAVYPIPDPNGRGPADILFNFVWYRNVAEGAELESVMRDRTGVRRPISLPAGAMPDRWAADLKAAARSLLPPAA